MTRITVMPVLFASCLQGCASHSALPALSIHALLTLHRRELVPQQRRENELALSVQVSFAAEPERLPGLREAEPDLVRVPRDIEPCAQTALCEWARLAEESALRALGVEP